MDNPVLVNTEYGDMWVYPDQIGKVFIDGFYYESGKVDLLLDLVENTRIAIDVGANYGSHSKRYANVFDVVYAFEPQPELFELLLRNVPTNVQVNQLALGHYNGQTWFSEPFKTNSRNYGAAGISTNGGQMVQIQTLDYFHLPTVDLIKIDVEGAEELVLYGAQETIQRCKPLIFFERWKKYTYLPDFNGVDFLLSLGYSLHEVGESYILATQSKKIPNKWQKLLVPYTTDK